MFFGVLRAPKNMTFNITMHNITMQDYALGDYAPVSFFLSTVTIKEENE